MLAELQNWQLEIVQAKQAFWLVFGRYPAMHVLQDPAALQLVHSLIVQEKQLAPLLDGRNPVLQV